MKRMISVDVESGEIVGVFEVTESGAYPNNHIMDGILIAHCPEDLQGIPTPTLINLYYYRDNEFRPRDPRPTDLHRFIDYQWVVDLSDVWAKIRDHRNGLIFQTDWTQFPDSPLSEEKKAEWRTYRQALRDIPVSNSDITAFNEVNWPTEPS